jgi:hypothetical protein
MADWWYTARMAAKKKTKTKQAKKVARKRAKPVKKARKPKLAKKSAASARKIATGKTKRAPAKRVRGKSETVDSVAFAPEGLSPRYGGQSGDLQGLSSREGANSESVEELLEEGNAFEAEIVKGVQDADDEGEVRTHEVPEDDVPGEYRDKDE